VEGEDSHRRTRKERMARRCLSGDERRAEVVWTGGRMMMTTMTTMLAVAADV
jgi:hypothetical protein